MARIKSGPSNARLTGLFRNPTSGELDIVIVGSGADSELRLSMEFSGIEPLAAFIADLIRANDVVATMAAYGAAEPKKEEGGSNLNI